MSRRWPAVMARLVAATIAGTAAQPSRQAGAAGVAPPSPCLAAIRQAEAAGSGLPTGLLGAIGMVESGRARPGGGIEPWPWSINVNGTGAQFNSKDEAIAAVQAAWRDGNRSIDVGCMQVNLAYHPTAFASLDDAFDPVLNVTYAAAFLRQLHGEKQDWGEAAGAYHSQTLELGNAYRARLVAWWPTAAIGLLQSGQMAGGTGRAAPARTGLARIDPHDVYTPEFRARLALDAADRARRMAAVAPAPGYRHGRRIAQLN